jgi:hypothetical protein
MPGGCIGFFRRLRSTRAWHFVFQIAPCVLIVKLELYPQFALAVRSSYRKIVNNPPGSFPQIGGGGHVKIFFAWAADRRGSSALCGLVVTIA